MMGNWKSKGLVTLFLLASAGGFYEFGNHMVNEDNIQVQVENAPLHTAQSDGLIAERETERRIAGGGAFLGLVSLIAAGAAAGRKSAPKSTPT
jgi:hypothetical protein